MWALDGHFRQPMLHKVIVRLINQQLYNPGELESFFWMSLWLGTLPSMKIT